MNGKRLFGALVAAAALFFVFPGIVGSWQKVGAMRAAVTEREATLAKRQEVLASAQNAYQEYQRRVTGVDGQKFTAFVPVKKDTAELVSALQAIAAQSGMLLTEINITESQTDAEQSQRTLGLGLHLEGSYGGFKQFLAGTEQYVRLLNVREVTVLSDEADGSLEFEVDAEAYFLK